MSDDIDLDDDTDEAANGPKALRDQLKKLQKQLNELSTENASLKSTQKKATLAELLAKNGAPERLAKYAERDLEDVSADAVRGWLEENGGDFGWKAAESEELDATAEQQERISRASSEAPQTAPGSQAQLLHDLQTLDYKTLLEKGLIRPAM